MKDELAHFIVDSLNRFDGTYRLYENYSGRGMFGETTTAIVIPSMKKFINDVLFYAEDLFDMDPDALLDDFARIRFDQLGMEYIIY